MSEFVGAFAARDSLELAVATPTSMPGADVAESPTLDTVLLAATSLMLAATRRAREAATRPPSPLDAGAP
ncbi:MAG: hypothetical protein JO168_14565 [Solirubrobacterales bacterium]|nr:hypothetical protein [Solirubrobacterales bacterium]MBV9717329.1 hypothetical protein [Solirubrobacterales bacterium]